MAGTLAIQILYKKSRACIAQLSLSSKKGRLVTFYPRAHARESMPGTLTRARGMCGVCAFSASPKNFLPHEGGKRGLHGMDVTGVVFTQVEAVTPVITAIFSAPARKGYIRLHSKPAGRRVLENVAYSRGHPRKPGSSYKALFSLSLPPFSRFTRSAQSLFYIYLPSRGLI